MRETGSWYGETGDEETLLLQGEAEDEHPNGGSDPFLPSPWETKSLNPFEPDIWLTLRYPLVLREKLHNEQLNDILRLNESINTSLDLTLKMTPVLFDKEKEAKYEPSHIGAQHGASNARRGNREMD